MCGILATIHVETTQRQRDESLKRMWRRGPDQGGQWESPDGSVWLGHRRLSIVDLSDAGIQPMHSADGSLSLVFNGEIYNYPSLRKELEAKGCKFQTQCDTEVLLHAYHIWGDEILPRLQGMFAFVLWDHQQQRVLAARDHLGIKPLFYAPISDGVIFGSDLNAMQCLLPQSPTPNPMAVSYLLTLGFITEPHTIWNECQRLPAGHFMIISEGKTTLQKYWEAPRMLLPEADETTWNTLFQKVIQEHLLGDTPIALFLSGGLDSTAVAAGLHQLQAPVEALTVSFPGAKRDESAIAAATSKHLNLAHRIIPLDKPDPLALIREVMHASDEPMGASGPLSKYVICKAAKAAGYKVVFGGDGGDEVFCGYPRFLDLDQPLSPMMRTLRPLLRQLVEKFGASPWLVQQVAKGYAGQDALSRHRWRMYPRFLPEEAQALTAPMMANGNKGFSDADMLAPYLKHYEAGLPMQRAMQRIDLMTYCADGELSRVDKVSMAHSLEWRVPMLDRRLVEFGLSQPYTVKDRSNSKPIIRRYLKSRVPGEVLSAPKKGFSIDNMDQLDLKEATAIIQNSRWVQGGYWSKHWKNSIQPAMPYALARLSLLLMMALWAEEQTF